jgi:hypothetical protein
MHIYRQAFPGTSEKCRVRVPVPILDLMPRCFLFHPDKGPTGLGGSQNQWPMDTICSGDTYIAAERLRKFAVVTPERLFLDWMNLFSRKVLWQGPSC